MIRVLYQRHIQHLFLLFIFSFLFFTATSQPNGEEIFRTNCAQCHAVGEKVIVGPGLKFSTQDRPRDWLHKWVRNSQALVKSGDPWAVEVFNQYNKVIMPNFNLTDEEIDALFAYVDAENAREAAAPTAAFADQPLQEGPENIGLILIIAASVLALLIYVLSRVNTILNKVWREKQGLPEPVPVPFGRRMGNWVNSHKKHVAVIILLLLIFGMKAGWDGLMTIGIHQGYQPNQPIDFSHKIHAGDNQIDCQYCHSSAAKGKTAGIPSANVCMNCHKFIQEGPLTGTTEIQKIYDALDYDPATQTYGPDQKPIIWTKVHNLPDLAYFNHAQHVTVGKVECQTCHGGIQEMGVAMQAAPLTMGWCLDCHRTTEVQRDNPFYAGFIPLSKKYDDQNPHEHQYHERLTVEKVGGLECARCHY
jgi:cytochrome c2